MRGEFAVVIGAEVVLEDDAIAGHEIVVLISLLVLRAQQHAGSDDRCAHDESFQSVPPRNDEADDRQRIMSMPSRPP